MHKKDLIVLVTKLVLAPAFAYIYLHNEPRWVWISIWLTYWFFVLLYTYLKYRKPP